MWCIQRLLVGTSERMGTSQRRVLPASVGIHRSHLRFHLVVSSIRMGLPSLNLASDLVASVQGWWIERRLDDAP